MLSVTQRIKTISQPQGGYVPLNLFKRENYEDNNEIYDIRSDLTSIQGLAVDYLTRYMLSRDVFSVFSISVAGALEIDAENKNNAEENEAMALLSEINGLDNKSILAACKIVCYDTAFRRGIDYYKSFNDIDFPDTLLHNVPILVKRCLDFFKVIGGIQSMEVTFEGGYTMLVSSGDGDFLSSDMLIDLKTSKNNLSTQWTLQLLMYYLLGYHSIHEEYKNLKQLCVFNPIKNTSYICDISNITDEAKYIVSHDVIGYKMIRGPKYLWEQNKFDYSMWQDVKGSDFDVIRDWLTNIFIETDFKISNYDDGIHDITIDDYWTFLRLFDEYKKCKKPFFKNTKSIKLIKRFGYFMFVSVSPKGKYSLLHGARLHALKHPLEYYYENIKEYATNILLTFSKFWDALTLISDQIKCLNPTDDYLKRQYRENNKYAHDLIPFEEWCKTEKEECGSDWLHNTYTSGKIHGCIVDIDYYNHLYINPLDGSITAYYAESMYDKKVYKSVKSLLKFKRPELLPSFEKLLEDKTQDVSWLSVDEDGINKTTALELSEKSEKDTFTTVYEYDMYSLSNKLKALQSIHDYKWIKVWHEGVIKDKPKLTQKASTKKKNTKKTDRHDKEKKKQKIKKNNKIHSRSVKDEYIGLTRLMHCGLKATCIDYVDCNNLTVRFSDGMIKTNVSSTSFNRLRVKHEGGYYENKEKGI